MLLWLCCSFYIFRKILGDCLLRVLHQKYYMSSPSIRQMSNIAFFTSIDITILFDPSITLRIA